MAIDGHASPGQSYRSAHWSTPMNQRDFEADLQRQGYQIFYGGLKPGEMNADHTHEWDARVLVIGGEITLTRGGKSETFRIGDSCAVAAGELHAEQVGPQGVAYVAGRRAATR
jgi:quercetin dioxygenase-like cupin family protein